MRKISGKFFIIKCQKGYEIGEVIKLSKKDVLVQWCFTKYFFMNKDFSQETLQMISEGELIKCPIKYQNWVPFDSIVKKVTILPEKQYFMEDLINNEVFFVRGSMYNPLTNELIINGISRCSECKQVINPDYKYIIEDEPHQLYHLECKY